MGYTAELRIKNRTSLGPDERAQLANIIDIVGEPMIEVIEEYFGPCSFTLEFKLDPEVPVALGKPNG